MLRIIPASVCQYIFSQTSSGKLVVKQVYIFLSFIVVIARFLCFIVTEYSKYCSFNFILVVYHHGKNAAGGHYTAAVHHANPFGWVNFDDNIIKTVNVNQVLKHHQGCVPYLLFYERIQTR